MEARPIDAKMLTRRCVVARLQEVTMPKFRDLVTNNAGGLLVLLPPDLSKLSAEEREVQTLNGHHLIMWPACEVG
jgi:hypothetical protein